MTSKSLKNISGLMWHYFLKYGPHSKSVKVIGATHFKKSSSFHDLPFTVGENHQIAF